MNHKVSHFKLLEDIETPSKKLKRVSSTKEISKKPKAQYRSISVSKFFKEAKDDIKETPNKILKPLLKNSTKNLAIKMSLIWKTIKQNINKEEILLIKDKNDIYINEILSLQNACENEVMNLFPEKMKQIDELETVLKDTYKRNMMEGIHDKEFIISSLKKVWKKGNQNLDIKYKKKFDDICRTYMEKFSNLCDIESRRELYFKSIYDNLMNKISEIINPPKIKKVKFNLEE